MKRAQQPNDGMSQERGTEGGEEKKERGTEEGEEKKKNNKGFFGTLSPTKGQMILQLERLKRKKHGECVCVCECETVCV